MELGCDSTPANRSRKEDSDFFGNSFPKLMHVILLLACAKLRNAESFSQHSCKAAQ